MGTNSILLDFLKRLGRSSRAHQAAAMYLSLVLSLALGIISSVITTRLLGPEDFGDFKFLQVIWSVGVTLVTFGVFSTGGIMITKKGTHESERVFLGSLIVMACVISVLLMAAIALASIPVSHIYGEKIGNRLWIYSILMFVFPFQLCLQDALRGTNEIGNLVILNVLPQAIYIFVALAVGYWGKVSIDAALAAYLSGIAITVLVVLVRAKPSFRNMRQGFQELMANNRMVGFHMYTAILITTVTMQLSQFSLAYFFDTRLVGIFALTITMTAPLTMIPNAIATTFFKQFASLDAIPRKVVLATFVISGLSLLCYLVIIRDVILLLYSEKFIEVVPLAYICAVGSIVHGIADLYNRYLLAHGKTMALRSNAIHLGVISILGYVFLVSWLGVEGAAVTKLVVDVAYLSSMFFYYKQKIKGHHI